MDTGSEWAQNKKVVDLSQKDVRKAVSFALLLMLPLVFTIYEEIGSQNFSVTESRLQILCFCMV